MIAPNPPPTDLERAVASLALDHGALPPERAQRMILDARTAATRPLLAQLMAEVTEADVLAAVAAELSLHFVDLFSAMQGFRIDEPTVRRCDVAVLQRGSALPMLDPNNNVVVAMANPADLDTVNYLRHRYPEGVSFVLSPKAQVQARLVYLASDDTDGDLVATKTASATRAAPTTATGQRSPVIDWVDNMFNRAVAEGASDIHLEFNADKTMLLRFRVDGILRVVPSPPHGREMEVIGTIIARAETMDSSNYREPQDGTFSFVAGGRHFDTRVALLPQMNGPTVVIRLLDSLNMQKRLDDMGFAPWMLTTMRSAISQSQGTILVAGPTGSGKTTTLYGMLREVDSVSRCVLTVEDPVEYKLANIGQTPIRSDLGERSLTFARALRSILRLDPDVILVGETRDLDTARTTMDAALTGHLCLSTIHAPSALRTYTRLIEMGVPAYMVVESISLAISQRLARAVHSCARIEAPTPEEAALLKRWGVELDAVAHPTGCPGCNDSGFRGRLAIAEMLAPSADLKSLILTKPPMLELSKAARADGFVTIFDDAIRHVREGRTTVTEVARTIEVENAFEIGAARSS